MNAIKKSVVTIIFILLIAGVSIRACSEVLGGPYPAPEISGIAGWINSPPLTLQQLRGKVVLIDFWTYSCINCIRTLPYITAWDAKYRDKGLVIIGIHSPEFAFEQNLANVQQAVTKYHIRYSVALDNNYDTWNNYHNNYWPAHYLINQAGNVVYTHFGEGDYLATENAIRALLGEKALTNSSGEMAVISFAGGLTPETYLGYERGERFASPTTLLSPYQYPNQLALNEWALQGSWQRDAQYITALQAGAAIKLHFYAKKVFLVLGSKNDQAIPVELLLNSQPISKNRLIVSHHTLYELVSLPNAQEGTLEIIAQAPGVEAYAFTFGE